MYEVKRSQQEIDDLRNRVVPAIDAGETRFRGMTYEQGIDEAIRWLFGETDDHPYEEDERG